MAILLTWNANPPGDNVSSYTLFRAPGLGQPFSAAVQIAMGLVLNWTDTTATPSTSYTYFLEASNVLGQSGPTAGVNATAPAGTIVASEAIAAGASVNVYMLGASTMVQNANATDGTRPCTGYVLASVALGAPATVFPAGTVNTGLSGLTPGTTYFLDTTNGSITLTPPSTAGNLVQQIGVSVSATALIFDPQPGTLL